MKKIEKNTKRIINVITAVGLVIMLIAYIPIIFYVKKANKNTDNTKSVQIESKDNNDMFGNIVSNLDDMEVGCLSSEEHKEADEYFNRTIPAIPASSMEFIENDYMYQVCENENQKEVFKQLALQVSNDSPVAYIKKTDPKDFSQSLFYYTYSVTFARCYKLYQVKGYNFDKDYTKVFFTVNENINETMFEQQLTECVNMANQHADFYSRIVTVCEYMASHYAYDWGASTSEERLDCSYTGSVARNHVPNKAICGGFTRFTLCALSYCGIDGINITAALNTPGAHSYCFVKNKANGKYYCLDTTLYLAGDKRFVLIGGINNVAYDNASYPYGSHIDYSYSYYPELSNHDFNVNTDNYVITGILDPLNANNPIMTEEEKIATVTPKTSEEPSEKANIEDEQRRLEEENIKKEEQKQEEKKRLSSRKKN